MRKNLLRLASCLLVVACASACTPLRSKLPPPYLVNDSELSATQLQTFAIESCQSAVEHTDGIEMPSHPFTTDGCSAWPESSIQSCCISHDIAYWCGVGDRQEIDESFRRCVSKKKTRAYANIAYAGVRMGGGRFMPFSWRFGYGHRWPFKKAPTEGYLHDVVTQSEPQPQIPPTSR